MNMRVRLYLLFLILCMLSACNGNSNLQVATARTVGSKPEVTPGSTNTPVNRSNMAPASSHTPTRAQACDPEPQPRLNYQPQLTADASRANAQATLAHTNIRHLSYNKKSWTRFEYIHIGLIATDSEQGAWFLGRYDYLLHFDDGKMISYTLPVSLTASYTDLVVDRGGKVWIAAGHAGVFRFDGQAWHQYTSRQGLPPQVDQLLIDPDDTLWAVMQEWGSIYRFNGHTWDYYWSLEAPPQRGYDMHSIAIDPSGKFWMTSAHGSLATLEHLNWYRYPSETFPQLGGECGVSWVMSAPDGSSWLNQCSNPYLTHFVPGEYPNVYQIPDLKSDPIIYELYVAPDSSVWVGAQAPDKPRVLRLLQWDGENWTTYDEFPIDTSLAVNLINAMAVTSKGIIWVATGMGLYHYQP